MSDDPATNLDSIDTRRVEVVAVVENLAVEAEALDGVVHAIDAAKEGRLSAP